jgi:chromosomal replication initiation ATPase DnaA
LPAAGPLAVDDADLAEETALFHLINAAMGAGRSLLLAGRLAPAHWGTRLPDLSSRLRASTAVGIGPAEDELLRPLLARLLAERQLDVPQAVQAWLLLRLPRHPAALAEAVARLDRAALAMGRGVTRALAAAVVNDMATEQDRVTDEILPHPSPTAPALL